MGTRTVLFTLIIPGEATSHYDGPSVKRAEQFEKDGGGGGVTTSKLQSNHKIWTLITFQTDLVPAFNNGEKSKPLCK